MKESENGFPIPYHLSIAQLAIMCNSNKMPDFAVACEALTQQKNHAAYEILKSHIHDKDKYRRLYVLKKIFRMPYASELAEEVENAVMSDDVLFVSTGLSIAYKYNIPLPENAIKSAIDKHYNNLYDEHKILNLLSVNENNYSFLCNLLCKAAGSIQQEIAAEVLFKNYQSIHAPDLFVIFSQSKNPKVRRFAVLLGREFG